MATSSSDALARELASALDGEVRFDAASRALYATDASVYQIAPIGVVVPRAIEDVVQTVQVAARHGVPITARGGGTSQAGQAIGAGLVVDTSKYLNRVLAVDPDRRTARVQPGVVLDELNATLKAHDLRFAPDVSSASRATVGGMIANNSSGARSVVYGKTIDHVRELTVVLADGRVTTFGPRTHEALAQATSTDGIEGAAYREIPPLAQALATEIDRRFPKILRRVGGYNLDAFVDPSAPVDLSRLIVGSEGTLALVLEATVGLVPLPRAKALLTAEFDELLDALGATPLILRHGPAAVEVMDDFILSHTRDNAALDAMRRSIVDRNGSALLCIEFYADHADELPPRLDALARDLEASAPCRTRALMDTASQARVWSLREAALGLSMATRGDGKAVSFVEDTAVDPERLRDYIARFLQIVERYRTSAGVYAHASVGCLHVRPVVNMKTADGIATFEGIASEVADLVLEFGGALSGEHGDGLVRGAFNERMFGPKLYESFRKVKRTFDPDGLFNPGRIVDTPPITSHLRFGAGYATPDPPTHFNYADQGGFGRAVEMCSGVGACRKTREGTMCPSYMATRDEAHSTRGRANVLRLALNGGMEEAGLDADAVRGVLDLCLECRACKSECPVNVDVGRYKSEFLARYWAEHGTPLKARAFGYVDEIAGWGSRFAPIVNRLAASALGRRLAEATIGLDRRRTPPPWTRRTLRRRLASRLGPRADGAPVLFADTFTSHVEPEIGVAAFDVLEAAGLGPTLAPHVCCGRPLISQGLLQEARDRAARNVTALYPRATQGAPIIFVEPSCLSAVREDAPDLLTGSLREKARVVAERAVLFEEHLEAALAVGRAALNLGPGPREILLHVHCHQRSMGLAASAAALLRRIPGATVTDLDAGCCGMAGSFGYTADHYDVSQAIGERKLLPAARRLGEGAVLAAAGTSCRHQVQHFTGVQARHPAVLIHASMEKAPA
ncbi:MAG TPA: FAD-linked oxidase C-terminal domain-containing protein [Vicinamibacterales bacterium]|nr:FAD-linked oxidase C-terminal domain-containing protein [Vicinamibacterales bacterium]